MNGSKRLYDLAGNLLLVILPNPTGRHSSLKTKCLSFLQSKAHSLVLQLLRDHSMLKTLLVHLSPTGISVLDVHIAFQDLSTLARETQQYDRVLV